MSLLPGNVLRWNKMQPQLQAPVAAKILQCPPNNFLSSHKDSPTPIEGVQETRDSLLSLDNLFPITLTNICDQPASSHASRPEVVLAYAEQQQQQQQQQVMSAVHKESAPNPKWQCLDHGCNGRQFKNKSSLTRHKREKSSGAKSLCPECGRGFSRPKSRDDHVLRQKCKYRRGGGQKRAE
jgi:hypothetical protein